MNEFELPPLDLALMSAPWEISKAAQSSWFHLLAECRGCHLSTVSLSCFAPFKSKN